jgi:hypothetical protein
MNEMHHAKNGSQYPVRVGGHDRSADQTRRTFKTNHLGPNGPDPRGGRPPAHPSAGCVIDLIGVGALAVLLLIILIITK